MLFKAMRPKTLRFRTVFLAALLVSPVLVPAQAVACGSSSDAYQAPVPTKPVLTFESLTAEQLVALDTYAATLKQAVTESKAALKACHSDSATHEQRLKEAADSLRAVAEKAGDAVPFRTIIIVGNGMLCGARIEVEVPPTPGNAEFGVDTIETYGKDRAGKRALGVISAGYLAEIFSETRKRLGAN